MDRVRRGSYRLTISGDQGDQAPIATAVEPYSEIPEAGENPVETTKDLNILKRRELQAEKAYEQLYNQEYPYDKRIILPPPPKGSSQNLKNLFSAWQMATRQYNQAKYPDSKKKSGE